MSLPELAQPHHVALELFEVDAKLRSLAFSIRQRQDSLCAREEHQSVRTRTSQMKSWSLASPR